MGEVRLSGQLVCDSAAQVAIVVRQLPLHILSTRAEDGCLSFEVAPTDDPLVWQVAERFRDATAFRAHQQRAATSDWGRETAGIERRYTVDGID
ncbi:antibiotic biosynthesis monooxygenase [Microbacterium sp. Root61]|uniref:putative quinol monooxygenase n=1 Tax=Microbacterium sp. Root61 TaxID=1736570 RepID=UPI0006F1DE3D|nr:antibiotic biosynthesis monooxygenase [Microbacterium sp. Root61]KRA23832.1 antibiotic biosynthesis monooxygenase [Microbacterium sp. Root61]